MAPTGPTPSQQPFRARQLGMLPSGSPENEAFPDFSDGDVVILISGSRRYQLHADTLKRSSPTFAKLLQDKYISNLSAKAIRKGVTVRSRLVLVSRQNGVRGLPSSDVIDKVLAPSQIDSVGKLIPGGPAIEDSDVNSLRATPPIYTAFDNVLGAFYNRPMDLGDSATDELNDILDKALEIVKVAEYLGVKHMVLSPIEATLQSTNQILYHAIANFPAGWLQFGYRIRSKAIYREALIHAIGKYNHPETQTAIREKGVPEPIIPILVRRGEELKARVKGSQRNMLSYHPQPMQRDARLGSANFDKYSRADYGNDIFWWMAMTIFRSWLADKLCIDATHHAEDLGFALFQLINKGGDAYIGRDALKGFTNLFPLSNKGMNVVENHLSAIKKHVKETYVDDLFQRSCHLDVERFPQKHFTCFTVGSEDFPAQWDRFTDGDGEAEGYAEDGQEGEEDEEMVDEEEGGCDDEDDEMAIADV